MKILIRAFSTNADVDVDVSYALVVIDAETKRYLQTARELFKEAKKILDNASYIVFHDSLVEFYDEMNLSSLSNEQEELFDLNGYVEVSEDFGDNEIQSRTEFDEVVVYADQWHAATREKHAPQEIQTQPIPFDFLLSPNKQLATVKRRVQEIQKIVNEDTDTPDYEAAHSKEQRLYIDVLESIVAGANDPNSTKPELLAAEALKIAELEFPRW